MNLYVVALFSVALAAPSEKFQDGAVDESKNAFGSYEADYRSILGSEYAPEQGHLTEYAPESPKVLEELGYGPEPFIQGRYGLGHRYLDHEYRRFGREGLGFDKRTAYAMGLRFPLTPKILETVYRHTEHDNRHVLKL